MGPQSGDRRRSENPPTMVGNPPPVPWCQKHPLGGNKLATTRCRVPPYCGKSRSRDPARDMNGRVNKVNKNVDKANKRIGRVGTCKSRGMECQGL